MVDQIKTFFRVTFGLAQLLLTGVVYLAVFAGLLFASFLILSKGIEDYGLLAGILVSIPFIAVVWFGTLAIAAWLTTLK